MLKGGIMLTPRLVVTNYEKQIVEQPPLLFVPEPVVPTKPGWNPDFAIITKPRPQVILEIQTYLNKWRDNKYATFFMIKNNCDPATNEPPKGYGYRSVEVASNISNYDIINGIVDSNDILLLATE